MANLPRIRSAKEVADELRKLDPGTKFCEHHIRYLMRSGAVPVISAGRRQFVNLDTLIEYLATHPMLDLLGQQQEQGIRKVPRRRWVIIVSICFILLAMYGASISA